MVECFRMVLFETQQFYYKLFRIGFHHLVGVDEFSVDVRQIHFFVFEFSHIEEALKKDSECFEKGGDKVDCSAAMGIVAGERNRRMLEIK